MHSIYLLLCSVTLADITLHGEPIRGSPFSPAVKQAPAGDRSRAEGAGFTKAYDNRVARFTVLAFDEQGKPVWGDDVAVTMTPNAPGLQAVPCSVVDNGDGTYTVEYAAEEAGEYVINATIDGASVSNAPKVCVLRDELTHTHTHTLTHTHLLTLMRICDVREPLSP